MATQPTTQLQVRQRAHAPTEQANASEQKIDAALRSHNQARIERVLTHEIAVEGLQAVKASMGRYEARMAGTSAPPVMGLAQPTGGSSSHSAMADVASLAASNEGASSLASVGASGPNQTLAENFSTTPSALYPAGRPMVADVNQGSIGDCDVMSALAGLAKQAPATILNAISGPDASNNYQVKMFDPNNRPVTMQVSSSDLPTSNGKLTGATGKGGTLDWASVMEGAIAKYDKTYHVNGGNIAGEGSEAVIRSLTGANKSYAVPVGSQSGAEAINTIGKGLAAGDIITGGFAQKTTVASGPSAGQDLYSGHGYMVEGTTTDASGQTYVQMRNPWGFNTSGKGPNDTKDDGVVSVPLSQFQQLCDLRVIPMQ